MKQPHRYGRRTVQIAVRTPKKDGTWSYAVLVSTDTTAPLKDIVLEYDRRSGAPGKFFLSGLSGTLFTKIPKGRVYRTASCDFTRSTHT